MYLYIILSIYLSVYLRNAILFARTVFTRIHLFTPAISPHVSSHIGIVLKTAMVTHGPWVNSCNSRFLSIHCDIKIATRQRWGMTQGKTKFTLPATDFIMPVV